MKKHLSIILVFLTILCSFVGFRNDNTLCSTNESPFEKNTYVTNETNLYEVIGPEEISGSTYHAAIIRQLSARKNAVSMLVIHILLDNMLPTLFLFVFFISSLYCYAQSSSHRFIINFIHNKDGQKA